MAINRRSSTALFLTLTACPQNDGAEQADEIGSGTSVGSGPDMLGDTGKSTSTGFESTDDGVGTTESTEPTSDGGSGNDNETGETGSQAVPTSLEVESNGERIGYLTGVWDFGYLVWDDVNEVQFQVNQQTGHVATASGSYYYTTPNCTGQRYEIASSVPLELCGQVPAPVRRFVRGDTLIGGGHDEPPGLLLSNGVAEVVAVQSFGAGNCIVGGTQICGYPVQPTNVIPVTFALPLTVAETTAVP